MAVGRASTITFDTVADMQGNSAVTDGTVCITRGYLSTEDGGGNRYRYSSSSSATANGGFVVNGPGGTGRFIAEDQSIVNVCQFGAIPGAGTDRVTQIQAAIDAAKPSAIYSGASKPVYFPPGLYEVSVPIKVYSQQKIYGDQWNYDTTTILARSGFTGTAVIATDNTGLSGVVSHLTIENLTIDHHSSLTLWAINLTAHATSIGNSNLGNLLLKTCRGILADVYCQFCYFHDILFRSDTNIQDKMLKMAGNDNQVERFNKEQGNSGTAATTDPYVEFKDWTATPGGDSICNRLAHFLIEGVGATNKKLIKLSKCQEIEVEDLWFETVPMPTSGALTISDCQSCRLTGFRNGVVSGAITVDTGSYVEIDCLNLDAANPNHIQDVISVSTDSFVHIKDALTRYGRGVLLPDKRIVVDRVTNMTMLRTPSEQANVLPVSKVSNRPVANMLNNGSFEMGSYLWTYIGTGATYPNSTAAPGKMISLNCTSAADYICLQEVTISSDMVGKKLTFSFLGKSSANSLALGCVTNGLGVVEENTHWAAEGTEWQLISKTFACTSSGTLTVGCYGGVGGTHTVDECRLALGDEGYPGDIKVQDIQLKGLPLTFGTAAPTTGTWPTGAIVLNSVPTTGQPAGWGCSSGGSPGTWKAMANYA